VKWWLAVFIGGFSSYGKVYGTLAFAPIFLVWIYLGWTAILLGASFAASMSAFRYQPVSMRLPVGYEFYGLLRMIGRFAQARAKGLGLHSQDIHHLEPMLTDQLVQHMLGQLSQIGLVSRAESGEWLLARDLETLTVGDLYEACQLRVPIAEAHLPCREDPLGQAAAQALDELRLPLREVMKRRVSSIYETLE
jgi:membrane protein